MFKKPFENLRAETADRPDTELMSDVAVGNHAAFRELMARYKSPLYRFILRYVGAAEEAEDLLQDTFVSIYSKASTYDPAWKPSTWIYRIALNKCRDYGRKQKLRKVISLDRSADQSDSDHYVPEIADLSPDVENIVIHRQQYERLSKAIAKLPHNMRSALVLHTVEGRSQAECSEILGVSRKSVEMLVYRARKSLREEIGIAP